MMSCLKKKKKQVLICVPIWKESQGFLFFNIKENDTKSNSPHSVHNVVMLIHEISGCIQGQQKQTVKSPCLGFCDGNMYGSWPSAFILYTALLFELASPHQLVYYSCIPSVVWSKHNSYIRNCRELKEDGFWSSGVASQGQEGRLRVIQGTGYRKAEVGVSGGL